MGKIATLQALIWRIRAQNKGKSHTVGENLVIIEKEKNKMLC
jgi:hypothetical protein